MNCSRTDYSRQIDYSAVVKYDGLKALVNQVARRLSMRRKPMTIKELQKWFHATPPEFVEKAVRAGQREHSVELRLFFPRRGELVQKFGPGPHTPYPKNNTMTNEEITALIGKP